jgi:hypothetical protein
VREAHEEVHGTAPRSHDAGFGALTDRGNTASPPPRRLPNPPDLARVGGMMHWYVTYRLASMQTHATLSSAVEVGVQDDGSLEVRGSSPETALDRVFLSLAAHMTIIVATVLSNRLATTTTGTTLESLDRRLQEMSTGLSWDDIQERSRAMEDADGRPEESD